MKFDLIFTQKQLPLKKLMMSPHMQKALHILPMSTLELKEWIEKEVEENPILEITSPTKFTQQLNHAELLHKISLYDHLLTQVSSHFRNKKERIIAKHIIGNLDEKGYFTEDIYEMCRTYHLSQEKIEKILKTLQFFDPIGVASRNLQECLLSQIESAEKQNTLSFRILKHHFDDFLHRRFEKLAKKMNTSLIHLQKELHKDVKQLYTRPSHFFEPFFPTSIYPDIEIGQEVIVEKDIPQLTIQKNNFAPSSKEDELYFKQKTQSALFLLKNLRTRRKIMESIAKLIIKEQKSFFEGRSSLKPLKIKETAHKLQVHESTLRRTLQNKFIKCEKGIFPLQFFFSMGFKGEQITQMEVLEKLKDLIQKENKKAPLSDRELAEKMKNHGYFICRRTISKYRHKLKIHSQSQRKGLSQNPSLEF